MNKGIALILAVAFFLRIYNIGFPPLSADEARITFRGYTLANVGKDELGRTLPILFNSLTDYQLPAVSYLTSLGVIFFGKSDLGVRIPFILIGVGLIFLIYKIAQILSPKREFWILSALVVAFSPGLIFLSKIPNESILLTFMITLLFYLLTIAKVNLVSVLAVIILSLLTSKLAWFLIPPFVFLTLMFFQVNLSGKFKINLSILCLLFSLAALGLFLQVPQSQRSLSENNFPIFSDITIKNGIDKLRGQGIEAGWSPSLARLLFNKSHYLTVGFFHWMAHLQPAFYFGQFDAKGEHGFMSMGAWSKITLIPFFLGLVYLVNKGTTKEGLLILYFLVLTFPLLFIYPKYNQSILAITLPFMSIVVVFGLMNINQALMRVVIGLIIFEVIINLLYLKPETKNAQGIRPDWIRPIVADGYVLSQKDRVAFSDNIISDIVPFLEWYTQIDPKDSFFDIPSPYKFRQTQISDSLKVIGSDNNFYNCGLDKPTYIFASKRDLEKIQKAEKVSVNKVYKDSLGSEVAYLLPSVICVK